MATRILHGLSLRVPADWEDTTLFRFAVQPQHADSPQGAAKERAFSTLLVTRQSVGANADALGCCLQAGTSAGHSVVASGAGTLGGRDCLFVEAVAEPSDAKRTARTYVMQAAVATQDTTAAVFTFSSSEPAMAGMPEAIGLSRTPAGGSSASGVAPMRAGDAALSRTRAASPTGASAACPAGADATSPGAASFADLHGVRTAIPASWEDWSVYRFLAKLDAQALEPALRLRAPNNTLTPTVVLARLRRGPTAFDDDNRAAMQRDRTFRVLRSGDATYAHRPIAWQDVSFQEPRAGLLVTQRQHLWCREDGQRVLVTLTGPQAAIESMVTALGLHG